LLVYPSPVLNDSEFGVTCRRVDGAYEAGQGRNTGEARAIVEEAAALMRKRIDRSIGIVAVNNAQSELIEGMMDELAASDPQIQAYRQAWDGTLEAFFVKNLENVQGDERDFILISTVYGKTAEGVFHQNFGPINKAYGHRRLNVLFTRAKRRLALFTSLDHSQIVADGKQRGVRVLKEFLEYASVGSFQHGRRTGLEPDSDFERWFLTRLKSAGYDAHPQVGVAKYRIDIGIIHPDKPGMGVHFMNPVPVMALVELIRGIATDEPTFAAIRDFTVKLGKTPANAEDFPAFIVNRILMPMINEAVYTLYEGVGSVESIDTAMRLGANHPMGPLQLADFIGLDTCLAIMHVLYEGLADSKYRPCPLLVKYVEAGWLGRKSKRGFYDYRGEHPIPTR